MIIAMGVAEFRLFVLIAAGTSLATQGVIAEESSSAMHAAVMSITHDDMQRHVDVLADDTFEGRAAGTRGGHAASVYLRRNLAASGVEPMGADGDYFQYFRGNYRNILAKVEGSDPELKDEYVLVGAHYDHVGYGRRSNSYGPTGYIHNGADDNASGAAAVLELAEALQLLNAPPRRSILLALWDGEENGLLGSKHFVGKPLVPLEQIQFIVNMDMIGRMRDDNMILYGSRTLAGSRQMLSRLNTATDMRIDFDWEIKANSDHHPFFARRIPYLMPHTGLHDDYHRPRDDAHKINAVGMEKIGRILLAMVSEVANQDKIAPFRGAARNEFPATRRRLARALTPLPKRLGVAWHSAEHAADGLEVAEVRYGRPGQRAGIRVGDHIVEFAGVPTTSDSTMRAAVFGAENPVTAVLRREGEAEPVAVTIQLDGRPLRLGIAWRVDDAEPNTVIINRVTPGSPAALAGIVVNDRVYEINGQAFGDSEDFGVRVRNHAFPIPLLVEREGRLQTRVLEALLNSEDGEVAAE